MEIDDTTRRIIAIYKELDNEGKESVMAYIQQIVRMNKMEKRLNEFEARLKKLELRDTLEQQVAALLKQQNSKESE